VARYTYETHATVPEGTKTLELWLPLPPRKHPELKDYFFGGLSGSRVLFTRARDFLLEPDGDGTRRNYFIYPIARADGADVPGVEWTFRYTDVAPGGSAGPAS